MATSTTRSGLRLSDDISKLVGETPMLHMKKLAPPGAADIFAKLEYLNPGGSVKDRAAIGLIARAESEGKLKPGGTVIEATAGNTGIGLALIGVSRGYKVRLFVPEKFSEEKVIIMRALGAEVTRTPEAEGMQGAIDRANDLLATVPGAFMAAQFDNPANTDYHYETERLAKVHAVAVETEGSILGGGKPGPHKVEGIGSSFIPKNFDSSVCDEIMMVTDVQAFGMVKELAAREGVLGGSSAGANVYAAVEIAKRLGAGKRVVTLIPDSAERYLSKKIFEGGI
ncbi:MAG: cysteine synthase family protein [Terriglobales bacterium]